MVGLAHAITHHDHAVPELDDVSLVRKVESELFRDRTFPRDRSASTLTAGSWSCVGSSMMPRRSTASSARYAWSRASVTSRTCSTRRVSRRQQAVHTATRARRTGTCRHAISEDDELDLDQAS
jgi:hypothetical protein